MARLHPNRYKIGDVGLKTFVFCFLLVCKCVPSCIRVRPLGSGPWTMSKLSLSQGHTLQWMGQAGHACCRQHIHFNPGSGMTTLAATNEQTSMTCLELQPVGMDSPESKIPPPPVWFRKQASDLAKKGFFSLISNHSLSDVTALFVLLTLGCRVSLASGRTVVTVRCSLGPHTLSSPWRFNSPSVLWPNFDAIWSLLEFSGHHPLGRFQTSWYWIVSLYYLSCIGNFIGGGWRSEK